eukprot:1275039-Rhodomonas_salina.2
MNAHLARLEELREQFDTAEHDQSGKLPVGPAHCQFEDELKPYQIHQCLRLSHTAYTVNYAPQLVLGWTPLVLDIKDHQKRTDWIFTPLGTPAPMDLAHTEFL